MMEERRERRRKRGDLARRGQRDGDDGMGRWDFGVARLAADQTEAMPTEGLSCTLPLSSTRRRMS
jgi:hypothetical protein